MLKSRPSLRLCPGPPVFFDPFPMVLFDAPPCIVAGLADWSVGVRSGTQTVLYKVLLHYTCNCDSVTLQRWSYRVLHYRCVARNCCVTPILTCCCSKVDHKLHFWDHRFIKFQTELEHYIVDGRKKIDLKVVLTIFQHNHIYQGCWKVGRPTYQCICSAIQGTRS